MFVQCEVALESHLNYEDSYDEKKFPINNSGFDYIIRLSNDELSEDDKIEIDGVIGYCEANQYKVSINNPRDRSKYPNLSSEYMTFFEKRINVMTIVFVDVLCYNLNDNYKCRCNYQ